MSTVANPRGGSLHDLLADDPRVRAAAYIAGSFGRSAWEVLSWPPVRLRIEYAAAVAWNRMNSPDAQDGG